MGRAATIQTTLEGALYRSAQKDPVFRSSTARRQVLSQDQREAQDFGQTLFKALLPTEDLRHLYYQSLDTARTQGAAGLRLRLRIETPDLATLPWEFLFAPLDSDHLGLKVPIVRDLSTREAITPLKVTPPLRILAMVASPKDEPALNVDDERNKITEALRALPSVELTWLPGRTAEALQDAVRQDQDQPVKYHIFHFIGHGGFDEGQNEGFIQLEDEEGSAKPLVASALSRLLRRAPDLRLAVLNSCDTARGGHKDGFASFATTLVSSGDVPAVLAMQFPITDNASRLFAREFYKALGEGLPIDAAVTEGRIAISDDNPRSLEWATPALILRAPDGVLFEVQPASAVRASGGGAGKEPPSASASVLPAPITPPTPGPSVPHWSSALALPALLAVVALAALLFWAVGRFSHPWDPPTPSPGPFGVAASCDAIHNLVGSNEASLFYTGVTNKNWQIYSYDFATCQSRQLTDQDGLQAWAPWVSHARDRIAYVMQQDDGPWQVATMNTDGTDQRPLSVEIEGIQSVLWSPDDRALWTIDGGGAEGIGRIVDNGQRLKRFGPKDIVYVSTTNATVGSMAYVQHPDGDLARSDLFLQPASGDETPIATNSGEVDLASISSDGKHLAFQVNDAADANTAACPEVNEDTNYQRRVVVASAPNWRKNDLDRNPYGTDNWTPVWDPSGQRIAYVSRVNCDFSVWIDNPKDGSPALRLDLDQHDWIFYLSWGG